MLLTAYELLCANQPDDEPLRPDELNTALVWRIGVLTDPTSAGRTDGSPPPADLDQLPTPDGLVDDDWLASVAAPDDPEPDPPGPPEDRLLIPLSTRRAIGRTESDDAFRVERRRLLEFNEQAAAVFTAQYRGDCSGGCWDPDVAAGEFGEDVEGSAAVLGRGG